MPPVTARPLVRLDRVSKRFRSGTLALDGIDLAVDPGEFLCLLGPSGCGKSTILRLIAGLAEPSGGSITVPGLDRPGRLGFVFQEPTLMPWARVIDNVRLPLRLMGVPSDESRRRAAVALDRVGLGAVAEVLPRELSGGMRMRVSVARALVTEPALLLMDEPFAALDEITRQQLNDDLIGLWRTSGVTIVFVTHSVLESAYLASRILVMSARPGRIAHEARPERPDLPDARWRLSAGYTAICAEISAMLAEASRR